jgi:CDC48 subfamily AAA family ATPase
LAAKKKKTPNTTPTKPVGQLLTKGEPLKSFPIRLVADPIKSQSTQRDFVYVNVKTMKEYGLSIGAGVFLYNDDKQQATDQFSQLCMAIVWPSNDTPKDHIQMTAMARENCGVALGEHVMLTPIRGAVQEATKVVVKAVSKIDPTESEFVVKTLLAEQLAGRYMIKGNYFNISLYGAVKRFIVESFEPDYSTQSKEVSDSVSRSSEGDPADSEPESETEESGSTPYKITTRTTIDFKLGEKDKSAEAKSDNDDLSYANIGGLREQIKVVREIVEIPLKRPEIFTHFGLKPPRGLLLYGPSGTGKTLIARVLAKECGARVFVINGGEVMSKFYGESESRLRDIFKQAAVSAPSLIFIDEIDALAPQREQSTQETEKRVVGTLLSLMDGIDSKNTASDRVVVVAATNRPNALDPALRRPGRFDREVEIGIPNESGRKEILEIYLRKVPHTLQADDITYLASITHGYVGADLNSLCKEAALKSLKRAYSSLNFDDLNSAKISELKVTMDDFTAALAEIRPSAMREVMVEIPNVSWDDIGGYEEIKQKLKEAVEWPIKHPQAFTRMGIRPPQGILLYGPPGCSKTLLAKAIASQSKLNFIPVKGPELFNKYVGESERAVREIFRKARAASPAVIFFDEIDALAPERGASDDGTSVHDRVLSQMLNELDGISPLKSVIFLAATNRPDIIDKALMRPGRIDRILFVGPPDRDARIKILNINLKKIPHGEDVNIEELADKTEGYSGAEITSICREAALYAMQQDLNSKQVEKTHFMKALEKVPRGITPDVIEFYKNYQNQSKLQIIV